MNWNTVFFSALGISASSALVWAIAIGAMLALGRIIYAGIVYTASAGRPSMKEDAKDIILQAAYGLLLLLTSYIILNTINPA